MKLEEQFVLILIVSVTLSRGLEMLWQPYGDVHVDELMKTAEKQPVYSSFSIFMRHYMNNHTGDPTENPLDDLPILISDDTVDLSDDSGDEMLIPADYSTSSSSGTMNNSTGDDAVIPSDDSMTEIYTPADYSKFSTITPFDNPMDNLTYHLVEDSATESVDEPKTVFIQPQPKTFTVQIREFHECVSCNEDPGARKYYDQCLQELSSKHQDILKSCCNTSFDNEFCNRAASEKIDYKTICADPEKALKVGDCFWLKIEDKNTDDIQKYRECKEQILGKYCTVKSSSDA